MYNGDKTLQSPGTITLKANPQNCSIANWYYYNGSDKINISSTEITLDVSADSTSYFPTGVNSRTFGVQSNVENIYDEITIVKVYDGAAGDSAVVAVLSNESQTISFDKNGDPIANAYADAYTVLTVYDGNDDVTNKCVITPDNDATITGTWDNSNYKYTVSSITASGKVSFKIEYSDPSTNSKKILYKTFSLVMTQPGADGADAVSYSMSVSALAVSRRFSEDGTTAIYSPNTITLNGYKRVGSDKKAYFGRFTVSVDGEAEAYVDGEKDLSTFDYDTKKDFTTLVFKMYAAGTDITSSTATPLDTQTVVQTSDGIKGADGEPGVGGVYTGLGNSSDQLACTNDGTPKAS